MKILFTGMASHHTKPSSNVTFFRTLADRVSIFAEIEWSSPSFKWTEESLNEYDYVVVGITPPTSPVANKLYAAMHVIDVLFNSKKLVLVIDHPQMWQYKHGFNSIDANPMNVFGSFYSKRKDFALARDVYLETISRANNKLMTQEWPTTIYPGLPWPTTRNVDKLLGLSAKNSLVPVNLDAFLINDVQEEKTLGPNWILEQKKSDWSTTVSKLLLKPITKLSDTKKISDVNAYEQIKNSFGFLLSPQDRGVGVWWSYRLIQALNSGTVVLSDWKETSVLGPEWSLLSYDLENQLESDIIKIAKLQKESYVKNIPTQQDSDDQLSSLFRK